MTCQHFTYGVDQHCHTMVGCNLRQKQLQQGQHLKKRCKLWAPTCQLEGWLVAIYLTSCTYFLYLHLAIHVLNLVLLLSCVIILEPRVLQSFIVNSKLVVKMPDSGLVIYSLGDAPRSFQLKRTQNAVLVGVFSLRLFLNQLAWLVHSE